MFGRSLIGLLLLAGCVPVRPGSLPPERIYGRSVPTADGAFEQVARLEPFPPDIEVWTSSPVLLQTFVRVNHAETADSLGSRAVDVFVRGAFPDGCTRLTDLQVERALRFIDVTLRQARPRLEACPGVNVPFQFSFPLSEALAPGAYVLTLNGRAHPFEVRSREPE